ncbi:potassium channel family protein [Halomicrobium salinisoli]|uniref:potassium channel family protein n=1 Tax=Halomicrobium salinisoli TaxID=2878391 RepID=UPI001CF06169|nr:potassium channel family protein [Halomicrobium salinisoli]
MNVLYLSLGVALLLATIADLVWTTLWVEGGAGPMTSRLMAGTWRFLRETWGQNSRALTLAGPLVFALGLSVWIALLWAGWTLVFASAETALIDTLDRGAISWFDLAYFAGYTIFTLGTGDLVPRQGIWQIVTVLATASGLLFVTLIVTYALSVLDAVTQKRTFASGVTGLGMDGESVLRSAWNGEEFEGLELPLNEFTGQLNALTANHKAYPILHYFYTDRPDRASTIGIAVLDEALTLVRYGVPERHRPDAAVVQNARASVGSYLDTIHGSFIEPADQPPRSPDLDRLRESDVPTVSDEAFAESLDGLSDRRRMLLGLVQSDAREWPSRKDDRPHR